MAAYAILELEEPAPDGSFDFANRSMSTAPWPPRRTAHIAIAKTLAKSCSAALLVLGSPSPSQNSIIRSKVTSRVANHPRPQSRRYRGAAFGIIRATWPALAIFNGMKGVSELRTSPRPPLLANDGKSWWYQHGYGGRADLRSQLAACGSRTSQVGGTVMATLWASPV